MSDKGQLADDRMMVYGGVAILVILAVVGLWGPDLDPVQLDEPPEAERNVTCYTWVENGTAHANCVPQKVYEPDAWVNVNTKDCAEWTPQYGGEFAGERPCGADKTNRGESE